MHPGRVAAFASSRLKLYLHDNSVQCVSTRGVIQVDIRRGACILLLHGDPVLVARCFDAYFVPHNREDYSNYHRSRSRACRSSMWSRKLCREVIRSIWIILARPRPFEKHEHARFISNRYGNINFIFLSEAITKLNKNFM